MKKDKIENDEIEDAIVINRKDGKINIEYIVENLAMMEQVPEGCVNALTVSQKMYSQLMDQLQLLQ